MKLRGKRVAILIEDNYRALEVWYSMLHFREQVRLIHLHQEENAIFIQMAAPQCLEMPVGELAGSARPQR